MIRIVIAEDQQLLLGALGSLLNLEDDMEVVGQASTGEEAITLVKQMVPDVCIMDVDMPIKSGMEAAEELKDLGCKVIIITTFSRKGYYQRALKAGVKGYLLKDSPSELLANSIREVMAGKLVYELELTEEKEEEMILIESEQLTESNSAQPSNTIGTVKAYFNTIMDKIKLPTG